MSSANTENTPANPFDAIIAAGKELLPGSELGIAHHRNMVEARPRSLGTINVNALGMLGLAYARRVGSDPDGAGAHALSHWALPTDGMIAGKVIAVGISRSRLRSDRDRVSTELTLHSTLTKSTDHVGLFVRVDSRADGVSALDAGITVLGAPTGALTKSVYGDVHAHRPLSSLVVDNNKIDGFRHTGADGLSFYSAALPALEECGRIITAIAVNPTIVR